MECNHRNGYMGHKNERAYRDVRTACVLCVCVMRVESIKV